MAARKKDQDNPANNAVKVRRMPLGKGVFCTRGFPQAAIVGIVTGEILDDPDYSSSYCMDLGDNLSLEPQRPFRFLNHSCTPNCALMLTEEPKANHGRMIVVEALRDIQRGEELTIDYAWPIDSAIPCLCQSPKCRGWIVDRKKLPALKRRLARAKVN